MSLRDLKRNWNEFGKTDPFGMLIGGDRWKKKFYNESNIAEVYAHGQKEVATVMSEIERRGITLTHGEALDFGCGVGRVTQGLCEHFHKVYGVDISDSMIELANKHNSYKLRCKYIVNDSDNLMFFANNSLDFIYSIGTFLHMKPRYVKKYVKEFLRILKPGGTIIFELVEYKITPFRVVWKLKQTIRPIIPHVVLYSYRKLRSRDTHPTIVELYSIKRKNIISFLERNGGSVIDIVSREENEAFYIMYAVRKKET